MQRPAQRQARDTAPPRRRRGGPLGRVRHEVDRMEPPAGRQRPSLRRPRSPSRSTSVEPPTSDPSRKRKARPLPRRRQPAKSQGLLSPRPLGAYSSSLRALSHLSPRTWSSPKDSYFRFPSSWLASHYSVVSVKPRGPTLTQSSASVLSRKAVSPRSSAITQSSTRLCGFFGLVVHDSSPPLFGLPVCVGILRPQCATHSATPRPGRSSRPGGRAGKWSGARPRSRRRPRAAARSTAPGTPGPACPGGCCL